MNELVSIIMPSYNCEGYIAASIRSVLAQTYTDWELLIVDDCSTDNTMEVIRSFTDDRIRAFSNECNSGAAISRNKALREAKGRWIAFLDSDDLWHPEKLARQIAFMEKNNFVFSYTKYEEISIDGLPNGVIVSGPKHISKRGMYCYCWPGCLTVMYDARAVGLVQIADIRKNNDYAMWLRVCRMADCYLLPENLACYRKGRVGSISTHSVLSMMIWHYRLFRDAERLSIVGSLLRTGQNMVCGTYKKIRYVTTTSGTEK